MTQETGSLLDMIMQSQYLGGDRGVRICLPASYWRDSTNNYPVLFLQDGQNMFSSAGNDIAFGWGSWELDRTVESLYKAGRMQEIIMVAIDNSSARIEEYTGPSLTGGRSPGRSAFENYEKFLISELKPRIDSELRTLPKASYTAVMGSSLGGLCSLALAWDHPEIFGGAASLSGAFMAERPNFLDDILRSCREPRRQFRAYLDSGVMDSMGGDDGCARTEQVVVELRRLGWNADDLQWYVDREPLTPEGLQQSGLRRDKWAEAQVSQHNEFYWRRRSWRALTFLFPPSSDNFAHEKAKAQ